MKLGEAMSWLIGSLQRGLFPHLEDCCWTPLTANGQELASTLELLQVEKHVPRSATIQDMDRKLKERADGSGRKPITPRTYQLPEASHFDDPSCTDNDAERVDSLFVVKAYAADLDLVETVNRVVSTQMAIKPLLI